MNAWKRIGLSCLAVIVAALAPIGAAISQIKVTAATPSSAYQGTVSLDVVVSGSGFNNSAKVKYLVSGTTELGGIAVTKVVFHNSTELVTTIAVAETAVLANFDIEVTLDSGRKGKGTTLFLVKRRPNDEPPPPPTYPPGRYWHAFTSDGGTSAATSRLYMFGGDGVQQLTPQTLGDLWVYTNAGSTGATWTYVPAGSTAPGPRKHIGWSCGGGFCVASNGNNGFGVLKETWVFNETSQAWSQVNCGKRSVCPSARMFPTMAYDPSRGTHLLFGGSASGVAFNDAFTFSPGTMTWTSNGSGGPSVRSRAAATFVPALGRIVLFGGQQENVRALNDMYSWGGSAWTPIQQVVDATMTAVPSLHSHSIAWDPAGNRLIVTGGLVDTNDTPNTTTYYVTFSNPGGGWRAAWTRAIGIGCQSAGGSSPDPVIHPQARMAFDNSSGTQVFFGGVENVDLGVVAYDNTVECR